MRYREATASVLRPRNTRLNSTFIKKVISAKAIEKKKVRLYLLKFLLLSFVFEKNVKSV
jgi:hypothetical protein